MFGVTKIKEIKDSGWNLIKPSNSNVNALPVLKQLAKVLKKELNQRLRHPDSFSGNLQVTEGIHLAVDNLTNVKVAVEQALQNKNLLTGENTLNLLNREMEKTKTILQINPVLQSSQATEIGVQTLNLLFCAKQKVKRRFSVITPLSSINGQNYNLIDNPKLVAPSSTGNDPAASQMIISSSLLYQLHHSLFPAERMLVGAGKKNGQIIEIDGIFDVTGKANSGYVKADPNRLARALIVMSETEKYFAFWIHSHPGRGREMTRPSSTDLNQEAEWLKDYSPNLLNAIVVEDRFIRFWGKALDKKRVTLEVVGTGVKQESKTEHLYRLEF